MIDDHRCEPIVNDEGEVLGHALVAPDMDERGRAALLSLAEAVSAYAEQQEAANPEAAAERARRYAAGQERIRARLRRRGEL